MPLKDLTYPNYNKPTLIQEELLTIVDMHQKWLNREPKGYRADFSYQDLTMCDLSNLNLTGACFMKTNMSKVLAHKTNFSGALLQGANLSGADLSFSNLSQATFVGANLTNANLFRVTLSGATGNGKEIKSLSIGQYPCVYTSVLIQFACQRHHIQKWVDITDVQLEAMDTNARSYYNAHYKTLRHIIQNEAPAVESRYEDTRVPSVPA